MKHPELYKETMNTRRKDFTANLTRCVNVIGIADHESMDRVPMFTIMQ